MKKLLVALALFVLGCPHNPATLFSVQPAEASVLPGGVLRLVASQTPATWSVQEAGGGTVDASGNYTAPACGASTVPGTFHVMVTSGGRTATTTVMVADAVLSVDINPKSVTLAPGQTQKFTATVTTTCGVTTSSKMVTIPKDATAKAPGKSKTPPPEAAKVPRV